MLTDQFDASYWGDPEPEFRPGAVEAELREFAGREERLRGHVLFRTSGSSGTPQWVALSKAALRWSAERVNEHLRCGREDRWGLVLPVEHVGGFGVLARAAVAGGTALRLPGKWSARGFAEFCREERITVASLVPAQVYDLVRESLAAEASLRVVVVGGGALSRELARQAWNLGWPVRASYGMTETASQIATAEAQEEGEPGLPMIRHWEAKVDGEGRIAVRGKGLFSFYVTSSAQGWGLEHRIDSSGWFRTEDMGRITGAGRLLVEGRASRVVKILGELVSLDRLDRVWEEVSGDAGVTGVLSVLPDERRGFLVVLVTGEAGSPERMQPLREMFDERVAPYERVQRVLRIPGIPRSALGKVRHEELRRMLVQEFG